MTLTCDLYWSFRSPYSYLVTKRVIDLVSGYDVVVNLRIVHPAAIRNPAYFRSMNPLARPYFVRDCVRVAEFLGLPFRRPVPDPIVQNMTTLEIAAEQPLALRLGRLGIAACEAGRGLAYADEVSRLLWEGLVDNWHEGDHLAKAAHRAGLDLAALDERIAAEPTGFDEALAKNDQALRASGHWGVPTFVFEGEPFFGQDRFDVFLWRLKKRGLARR